MNGIVGWGSYIPASRLERKAIAAALNAPSGSGTRAVASYDEDTTSMGVEAARAALRGLAGSAGGQTAPEALLFATASPAYQDKTNATAIHAALALPPSVAAFDVTGAVRSGAAALWSAIHAPGPTSTILSDIRTGLPGGGDEREGGDAAVSFLFGPADGGAPVLAELVALASASAEFLDRWRLPGEAASRQWEERFGEQAYLPPGELAVKEVLKRAGITADAVDRLVVAGPHARAVKRVAAMAGARKSALADDLTGIIGNTGTAHLGLLLADALERSAPGELVLAVSLADGADAMLLRTTDALAGRASTPTVATHASGGRPISYPTFLTWRGFLTREPPRRPDPDRPAAPPAARAEAWKFAFTGSRCEACGARHVPPQRVCVKCHAVDRMTPERMADVPATIATFTVDRLAYSLSPPVVAAVIDFDGGGRFQCELTDVDPAAVQIGDRVTMTFRRLYTAGAVHNYFWKARPLR